MMTAGKIGLLMTDKRFRDLLVHMLTEAGLIVRDISDVCTDPSELSILNDYDVVIAGDDISGGREELILSVAQTAKGFLIADSGRGISDISQSSLRYINMDMSPEEIVFRLNDLLFQRRNIRRSPRVSVRIDVEYVHRGVSFRSSLLNLGHNGAFIGSLNPVQRNELISASFALPGSNRRISAGCRVLFSIGYDLDRAIISHPDSSGKKITAFPGMGVFFEKISDEDLREIELFIDGRVY